MYETKDGRTINDHNDLAYEYPGEQHGGTAVEHRYAQECFHIMLCDLCKQNLPAVPEVENWVAQGMEEAHFLNSAVPFSLPLSEDMEKTIGESMHLPMGEWQTVTSLGDIEVYARRHVFDYLSKKCE